MTTKQLFRIATYLAIVPLAFLSFNPNSTYAQSIDRTTYLTGVIAHNPLLLNETDEDSSTDAEPSNRIRSDELVRDGNSAEGEGNKELALLYYRAAIKADTKNGHAWLFAARLLSEQKERIDCLKIALECFETEGDIKCYEATREELRSLDVM